MNGIFLCMYALTLLENNANRWQNFELCSFIVFSTNTVCTVTGFYVLFPYCPGKWFLKCILRQQFSSFHWEKTKVWRLIVQYSTTM
jgi:hypothetical protein